MNKPWFCLAFCLSITLSLKGISLPVFAANEMTISIPDSLDNFPIYKPQLGKAEVECFTGSNLSHEWVIEQWKNYDNSLCTDPNNSPFDAECAGADFARETITMRTCYWKNEKRFHVSVNSENFPNQGCSSNAGDNAADPGGYGVILMSGLFHRKDWPNNPFKILGNLKELNISLGYETNFYADGGGCTPGKCDPFSGCNPISFANLNVMTAEFDPLTKAWKGTQFYTVSLFDSRTNNRDKNRETINCTLPASSADSFVNTGQPITYYGQKMALPGQGRKNYNINILPRVKHYIEYCYAKEFHKPVNFNNFRIDGVFFHTENYNTARMSNDFVNPQIKLTLKEGISPPAPTKTPTKVPTKVPTKTPTKAPTKTPTKKPTKVPTKKPTKVPTKVPVSTCTLCSLLVPQKSTGNINCDNKVDLSDFSIWLQEFKSDNGNNTKKNTWQSDCNCDGYVSIADFSIWRAAFK